MPTSLNHNPHLSRLHAHSYASFRNGLRLELPVLILLLLGFLVALCLTHPFANVLYGGDDWAYAWSVRTLLQDGKLQTSDWASASALPQTLWGTTFAYLFGFSPRTLNVSTMVAATAGLFLIYWLCRLLGVSRTTGAVVALFVAWTPLYLGYAGCFMSDMFYTVLMLAALLVYVVAIQRESMSFALLGGLLAAFAFLDRQVGVSLPAAFALTLFLGFLRVGTDRKRRLGLIVAGCLAPLLTFLIYQIVPDLLGGRTKAQEITLNIRRMLRRQTDLAATGESLYLVVLYVLVLLLPLFVLFGWQRRKEVAEILRRRRILLGVLAVLSTGFCCWRLITGRTLMVRGDFLHSQVYGAASVTGSIEVWKLLCLVASLAFAVLLTIGWDYLGPRRSKLLQERHAVLVFPGLCIVFHLFLTASFLAFFNSYFLPLLPLAAVLGAALLGPAGSIRPIPVIVLALLLISGSVLVLDAQLRNVEASYQTADELVSAGANSTQIYGFPSWYGWHHYDDLMADLGKTYSEGKGFATFSIFKRVLAQSEYAIRNGQQPLPAKDWVLLERRSYSTLHGKEPLDIWRRRKE